ncbi:MAG: deoxyribose-phosphate aldolase [Candidatus Marinimicrobia bacterium]|jgi:deoxyribose-phosphate aldolase|nr:deoxyribose-phosphate aldolase [Candidatus Neomarinimicrobiota bacterium]MBT3681006.1 deoxyribose-phosphate aldolase [Candidatus Neomarinimicrobiota bacterium]MBT3952139.1 deoxyribose-phosphate aldolase [Candidatus Neomarinimicrobiota bacterium]MBT4254337.1 deoxyribose-phosphate aldolase [Candidatus Neomarinimicrobiota bacterium]MBT4479518.1 deoxyribose-phosphate aldolase [Candidatus Neomarinimicrobiota bacterium]
MNLVNKEYHKRARILLENWHDSGVFSTGFDVPAVEMLAGIVELNLHAADASISEVNKLCKAAREFSLAGISVNPAHVERCVQMLGEEISIGTVIGFPLGANHIKIKVAETELAVKHGAGCLSMVLNIGLLKTSNFQEVFEELRAVRHACPEADLTIILETALLEPLQIIIACMLSREAGADAVMTSTGFSSMGATPENVSLMRSVLGDDLDIVASGGVKDHEDIINLIKVGATRLSLTYSSSDESLYGLIKHSDRLVDD